MSTTAADLLPSPDPGTTFAQNGAAELIKFCPFTGVEHAPSLKAPASTVQLAPSGSPHAHSEQLRVSSTPAWKMNRTGYSIGHDRSPSWKVHVKNPGGGAVSGEGGAGAQTFAGVLQGGYADPTHARAKIPQG
jgi:hypothetical protein